MSKVYIVTSGYYSDHHVVSVHSTEEGAREVAKVTPDSDVEEHEVDSVGGYPKDMSLYCVLMDVTGLAEGVQMCDPEYHKGFENAFLTTVRGPRYYHYMWARDQNHAIKIANERRMQMLAENRWGVREDLVVGQEIP